MNRRKVLLRSVEVAILSVIMGGLLASAWQNSIYAEATEVEAILLANVPGIADGALQIIAMFGLGLFFSWAILYAQDVRKNLQGYILITGAVLFIAVMATFDTLLPQMETTLANGIALVAGIGVAIMSESFKTPFHSETPALLELDFSQSSIGHAVRNDVNNTDAMFPVAARGIYVLVIGVVIFMNAALVASEGALEIIFATVFVSGIFAWRFHRFVYLDNPPEKENDVEILGPKGSGKTLFLYGLYLTVNGDGTDYKLDGSNTAWSEQTKEIRGRDSSNPWGATSTNEPTYYEFEFISTKGFFERIRIALTDFPGGWVNLMAKQVEDEAESPDSEAIVTDGGQSEDTQEWNPPTVEDNDNSGDPLTEIGGITQETAKELRENGITSVSELKSMSSSELENVATIGSSTASQIKDEVGSDESQVETEPAPSESTTAGSSQSSQVVGLRAELQEAETLILLIDTKAAVDEGLIPIEERKLKGSEPSEVDNDPKITEIRRILDDANPDRVIPVATKADFLIPAYMHEEEPKDPPHEELGDFEAFSDWLNRKFDVPPFSDMMADLGAEAIHPVYYQSNRQDNTDVVPVVENGLMQPEGYERIIDEVIAK